MCTIMLVVQATVIIYARTIYLLPPSKEKLSSIEKSFLKHYKIQPGCMEISFNKNINNNNISDSKRYKIFRA